MNARTFVRLVAKLFARPVTQPIRRPMRLRVEGLEAREVPAAYWVGDVDTNFNNAENWYPIGVPSPGDNLFFYGPGANGNFGTIDRDGDGIEEPRIPNNDCFGMTGHWYEVRVELGYSKTITLGANPTGWTPSTPLPTSPPTPFTGSGVTVARLGLDAPLSNIAQYHPFSGEVSPLTITGEEDPYCPAYANEDLLWYGGSINDTPVPSTVTVTGAEMLVSTVYGAVTLGSALVLDNSTVAEIQGEVTMPHPTGIDVLLGSALSLGNGTALLSAVASIQERQTIRVTGASSRLITRGAATFDLGLWVNGGTAEIQGRATGRNVVPFNGPVRRVDGTFPPTMGDFIAGGPASISAYMTDGNLIIDEGSELRLGANRVLSIRGGKLATRIVVGCTERTAYLTAGWVYVEQALGATTQVVIGDPSLNPPTVPNYVYSTLQVNGSVDWMAGTYRPLVNPANSETSLWFATSTFRISESVRQGGAVPTLGPTSGVTLPPVGRQYDFIRTSVNNILRQLTPVFEAGNTNWMVIPANPFPAPDLALWVERT